MAFISNTMSAFRLTEQPAPRGSSPDTRKGGAPHMSGPAPVIRFQPGMLVTLFYEIGGVDISVFSTNLIGV